MITQPRPSTHLLSALALALAAALGSGCGDAACLKTEDPSCRIPSPCKKLSYSCADGTLELRRLDAQTSAGGEAALGRRGDVLIGNDRIVAVIAGLGDQNYVELSGGSLLDLQPRGGNIDALNQVITTVGILPRDSASYTSMQLIDESPTRVAIQLRGTLRDQPSTIVTTLFELRPCEPGLRVRSAVYNGTPDPQAWTLSDGWYWSGREPIPFVPGQGRGFSHPKLDLLTVNEGFVPSPYLAASSHAGPGVSYGEVGCGERNLEGFHSEQISSFGMPREVLPPRGIQIFDRFIVTAAHGDAASAIDLAVEARAMLFGEAYVSLSGMVDLPAHPAGTALTDQVSLIVSEGEAGTPETERTPVTQITPTADGHFAAKVRKDRSYVVELHAFGRKIAEQAIGRVSADRDLGTLVVPRTARVEVSVADASATPLDAQIFVIPADETTRTTTTGSFHGQFQVCAPWLGPPVGGSPACNRFLVWHAQAGPVEVELPLGRYWLYAYHGPFHTIARQLVELTKPDSVPVDFSLRPLPLKPQGALGGDLHVHGAASFDSSIPDWDRVLSFAAADLDVIVATDHDVVYDYADMARQLGLETRLSTVSGVETTGHMPWFKIPHFDFPLVIGHYNLWPLRYDPSAPRNGGPFDELVEPGTLFDRTDPLFSGVSLIGLNHPWAEPEAGRDLGFPRALSLSTLEDLPLSDDGSAAGMYVRTPSGGHANDGHHAQEVMNGSANDLLLQYRAFWFYMLSQGKPRTGTANSDSHSLVDSNIGSPRNLVFTDTVAGPSFDIDRFNQAVRDGHVLGTNGPVIEASIVDTQGGVAVELPYGMAPIAPGPSARLRITVSAAPWIPVEEVRVIVNGALATRIGSLPRPADPFGEAGLVRLTTELPLAQLLDGFAPGVDAWIVVEAGAPLPRAADLGGGLDNAKDGIPDTTDNNGDGVIDERDIAPGKKHGPLALPAPPVEGADDYHFYQVVGGYPAAFTNPFLLDRDGNGRFDRIGVGGGR